MTCNYTVIYTAASVHLILMVVIVRVFVYSRLDNVLLHAVIMQGRLILMGVTVRVFVV